MDPTSWLVTRPPPPRPSAPPKAEADPATIATRRPGRAHVASDEDASTSPVGDFGGRGELHECGQEEELAGGGHSSDSGFEAKKRRGGR